MNNKTVPPPSFEVTYEMMASKSRRFLNYLIDVVAMYIIIFLLAMLVASLAVVFEWDETLIWMQNITPFQNYSIGFCVVLLYYGLPETLSSRTLGKLVTGTKVVMEETGAKPTAEAILKRTLCRFIPFEAISFIGESSRGWHDSISRTVVVDVKKYKEEINLKLSFEELGNEQDVA